MRFFSCSSLGIMWLTDLVRVTLCSKAGAVYATRNFMLLSPRHQPISISRTTFGKHAYARVFALHATSWEQEPAHRSEP